MADQASSEHASPTDVGGKGSTATSIEQSISSKQGGGENEAACNVASSITGTPDSHLVSLQLERMRNSAIFARCMRLFALLEFLVVETIEGRGGSLKELVIGEALYSRAGAYDPGIDSSVRVEARRLRRKLREYYEGPGRQAAVHITLPESGYCPIFASAHATAHCAGDAHDLPEHFGVDLAVIPFRTLTEGDPNGEFADGLTDELIYAIEQGTGLRILSRLTAFRFRRQCHPVPEAAAATGARLLLHGTLRFADQKVRITPELSDPRGAILWSTRFDFPAIGGFSEQEQLARQILALLPPDVLHLAALPQG